jgi:predicted GNAT superfamily acetyltransferase
VLAQGLRWVRWTYDPLEMRNAHVNLVKLGGFCRTYVVDLYGSISGHLNEGLPTDRFEVEWHVRSRHVADALAGRHPARGAPAPEPAAFLTQTAAHREGLRAPEGFHEPPGRGAEGVWYVEAPLDIQEVKRLDHALARAWRMALRRVFQSLFTRGFAASGVVRVGGGGRVAYRVEPVASLDLSEGVRS